MTAIAEAIASCGNPWALCIEQYGRALNTFWREVLGIEPDKWQEEANRAISQGHTRIAIRSGHGVGKTLWLACLVVWFTCTRLPFKVGMTAPSSPQLHDALLGELRAVYRSLPLAWAMLFDVQSDRIELKSQPDNCFVTARTSRADNPESLQGLHSENLLLVIDEASGVPEQVFEAAVGSMSTPRAITVMTGNPTRATGMFWRAFNMEPDRWWLRRVSCHESPRVDAAFIEEVLNRWGADSNQYRVRVLGEFPLSEDDTLIPAGLVESAMERVELPLIGAPEIWGVDVARFGQDQSSLVKRRGNRVTEPPRRWQGIDTMRLAGTIKGEFDLLPVQNRPQLIAIDVIGIGAGVVDRLLEQNLPVLGVNVGESPSTQGRFYRLRDQLWLAVREWLESRAVSLPYDDQLRADLCAPRVTFLSDGRMQVESKQQLRARGFRSPDSGDALCNTFVPSGMALQLGLGNLLNTRVPVRAPMRGME
jgi:phage terminase large subunit